MRFINQSRFLILLLIITLGGCTTRPGPELLVPAAGPTTGLENVTVLAVTDRTSIGATYGSQRGSLSYHEFTIGVTTSQNTVSGSAARASIPTRNFSMDFTTLARRQLDERAFARTVAEQGGHGRTILVFVHGYNYNYQEAVFRAAQLGADSAVDVVPILFSWPSQASVRGYVADRDAVTYARDDLVRLLTMLGKTPSDRRLVIVGHSMGGWLVVEALRQLRLQGRNDVIQRLQVGLNAPDIDVDVFRAQMSVIGPLSPPLIVLVSKNDRALALSQRLAEGRPRLGAVAVDDPAIQNLARKTSVRILDITAVPAGDRFNHDRFTMLVGLNSALPRGQLIQRLQHAGAYILDASGAILSAPFDR